MKDKSDTKTRLERHKTTAKSQRDFFVAETGGANIRICEELPDSSLRAMLWSKLTRAERRRGEEFVRLLAPDAKTLARAGHCAWKYQNRPKTVEVATALEEFVGDLERRHGVNIWVR